MTQETTLAGIMPTMYKGRTANRLMNGAEVVSINRHDSHSATLEGRTLVDEGASDKVPGARKRPEKSRTRKEHHISKRCSHFFFFFFCQQKDMLKSVLGCTDPLYFLTPSKEHQLNTRNLRAKTIDEAQGRPLPELIALASSEVLGRFSTTKIVSL